MWPFRKRQPPAPPAPAPEPTFAYRGYDIPVRLAELTGGGGDTFARIADDHIQLIRDYVGLRPDMHVVEIGCGIGRDAIPLTDILSPTAGSYLGIDVVGEMIAWDQRHITPRHPSFTFEHFDVRERWYNPQGAVTLEECRIARPDGSVDLIILQSVFTHMLRPDVGHYLREFRRVLRPDGRVFASFFILDAELLAKQGPHSYVTFNHEIDRGCWVNNLNHPTQIVGYLQTEIEAMMRDAGLELARAPLFGIWAGRPNPIGGQDTVIMRPARA